MTSVRAVAELKRCRGTQFDPKVIDAFLDRHAEIEGVGNWPPE
jgi:response regulator RpfG family c-di-GMP phosphodiesterase